MKKGPFKMKGYSYPGKSPLKEVVATSSRLEDDPEYNGEDNGEDNGSETADEWGETKEAGGNLKETATDAIVRALITKVAEKKKFAPVNIAGKQTKIM